MSKALLIFALFMLISCNEAQLDSVMFKKFRKFMNKYHKRYESVEEYLARFEVFKYNYMNSFMNEEETYEQGVTQFSDLTQQEFRKQYLNLDLNAYAYLNLHPFHAEFKDDAPDSLDWRTYGYISSVIDQGICGAAWAFSTIGNLEGMYAIKKEYLAEFSVQQLIDCDPNSSGCTGGFPQSAYEYYMENGIMLAKDYKYSGKKGTCAQDPSKYIDMKVKGYKILDSNANFSPCDENEMKQAVYEIGPLNAALNATPLQTYTGGIVDLNSSECSPSSINHTVLIVGYGNQNGLDYWICKNSWGTSWGESGYFRISRGKSTCGINYYVITGVVEFE